MRWSPSWSAGSAARSAASRRVSDSVESRVGRLALGAQPVGVLHQRQPRLAGR